MKKVWVCEQSQHYEAGTVGDVFEDEEAAIKYVECLIASAGYGPATYKSHPGWHEWSFSTFSYYLWERRFVP